MREEIFGAGHAATGWNLYDQACILALSGDPTAALDTLRLALDTGWANDRIEKDDDFDTLRGTPQFEAILEEVRSRRWATYPPDGIRNSEFGISAHPPPNHNVKTLNVRRLERSVRPQITTFQRYCCQLSSIFM